MAATRPKINGTRFDADPVQEFYSIGDVCSLTDLRPHVLRYWESQFRILNPAKNRSGNRVYARREVELVLLVKHLLYTEKYTIEGARQKLDVHRRDGELREAARAALSFQTIELLERELREIGGVLAGLIPPRSAREPLEDEAPALDSRASTSPEL
jgi:DNA-binding transcriptional MerR regulator